MEPRSGSAYLLLMLTTSLIALVVLGAEVALNVSEDTRHILDYADHALCVVFFIDFCKTLWFSPNRLRYFLTWGWIDLLSCIPTIDAFRAGRLARVFRIFRVLRAIRAAKILAEFILQNRARNALSAIVLVSGLLLVIASVGVLHFETTPDANIRTPEDALWWAATTITTVGYGDKYPVTTEGRLLGAVLMGAGVTLLGAYSGFVAYWFLRPLEKRREQEIAQLRAEVERSRDTEIRVLHEEIARLRAALEKDIQDAGRIERIG